MMLCAFSGDVMELERMAKTSPDVVTAECPSLRQLIDRMAGVVSKLERERAA